MHMRAKKSIKVCLRNRSWKGYARIFRNCILFYVLMLNFYVNAQNPNFNVTLLNVISPFNTTVGIGSDGRKYSGCWGYTHPQTNEEFAILGSCTGTYFYNITNPSSATLSAFVPGRISTSWREIKTFQNYCYVISDDPAPNSFQILDLSALPGTVTVVYDGNSIFERAHTLFVDNDNLYTCSVTSAGGSSYSSMNLYSLQNPVQPVLLRKLSEDFPFIPAVHDVFVNNDTIFASCGPMGLHIFRYDAQQNKFFQLGNFSSYQNPTANHSSWITGDRKHLVFCDEIYGSPVRLVNIENLSNITIEASFIPGPNAIPHNPYVLGKLAIISSYQDGLNIYNISDPSFVFHAGSFDTYPEGGLNTGNYGNDKLKGNWGAYPYFPSGRVIASDITNGLFIFDISAAMNATGVEEFQNTAGLRLFPNPANDELTFSCNANENYTVVISHISGREVYRNSFRTETSKISIPLHSLSQGSYLVSVKSAKITAVRKLMIAR